MENKRLNNDLRSKPGYVPAGMSEPKYLELLTDGEPHQSATFKQVAVVNPTRLINPMQPFNPTRPVISTQPVKPIRPVIPMLPVKPTVHADSYEVPNANRDASKSGKNSRDIFNKIDSNQTEPEDECHTYDYIVDKDEKGMNSNAYEKLQKTDSVAGPPKLKPRPEQMRMVQEPPKIVEKINGEGGCKPCERRLCVVIAVIIAVSLGAVMGYVVYRKVNGLPIFGPPGDSVTAATTMPIGSGFTTPTACPAGFRYMPQVGRCYRVIMEALNRDQAILRCARFDSRSHLAVIASATENYAAADYLRSISNYSVHGPCRLHTGVGGVTFYTSGQRITPEVCNDQFVWKPRANASILITYTNWAQGQPSCDYGKEDCLELVYAQNFQWNDIPCSVATCPLCQVDF